MRGRARTYRSNARLARATWGELSTSRGPRPKKSDQRNTACRWSAGDLQFLDGRWYITHAGLIRIARRKRCCGIGLALVEASL